MCDDIVLLVWHFLMYSIDQSMQDIKYDACVQLSLALFSCIRSIRVWRTLIVSVCVFLKC